jgi:deoxyribonuclease IV
LKNDLNPPVRIVRLRSHLKIGFHISIAKGFDWARQEAHRLHCDVLQLFVKNPRAWSEREWKPEERARFQRLSKEVMVFAHLSYLPNLARAKENALHMRAFVHEVESCIHLGIGSIVVHCGSSPAGGEETATAIGHAVDRVLQDYPISIVLENASGQGNSYGRTIGELARVFETVRCRDRLALCLDTAHLFQAGYNVRRRKTWDAIFGEVDRRLGKNKVALLHLNDSKTALDSKIDRHWHIGKGKIGLTAFRSILMDQRIASIPGVMETPKTGNMDEVNMGIVRSLLSPLVPGSSS